MRSTGDSQPQLVVLDGGADGPAPRRRRSLERSEALNLAARRSALQSRVASLRAQLVEAETELRAVDDTLAGFARPPLAELDDPF